MVTQFEKIKNMFNFFSAGGVRRPLPFFNCATYKNCHGHNLQTVNKKSNGYIVKNNNGMLTPRAAKKIKHIFYFFNYIYYFLLIICKLCPTIISMTIFIGCAVCKKNNGLSIPCCQKKLNLLFIF
jgi:hypothetical protein